MELVTTGRGWVRDGGDWREVTAGHLLWNDSGDETIARSDFADPYRCLAVRLRVTRGKKPAIPDSRSARTCKRCDPFAEELWRLSPAPVLCFDGDAAGGRAAARAAGVALPLIAPDRSLALATLPDSEDPDTLVRGRGPPAFAAVLEAARPLDAALFDLLRGAGGFTTPEQRSAFRARLEAAAGSIKDRGLASEYRRALLDRYFASTKRGATRAVLRPARPALVADAADISRAAKLTAILLHHPQLAHDLEEAYGSLPLPGRLQPLRDAMLEYFAQEFTDTAPLDSAGLLDHLRTLGLTADLAPVLEETPSCGRPDAQPAEAEAGWWHFYGLMHREGLHSAVEAARLHYVANQDDPAAFTRLNTLCQALERLRSGRQADEDEDALASAAFG